MLRCVSKKDKQSRSDLRVKGDIKKLGKKPPERVYRTKDGLITESERIEKHMEPLPDYLLKELNRESPTGVQSVVSGGLPTLGKRRR
jgi:hypothetical protein